MARNGGDEFVATLQKAYPEGAEIAEKWIRKQIEFITAKSGSSFSNNFDGYAVGEEADDTIEAIINKAERMYADNRLFGMPTRILH